VAITLAKGNLYSRSLLGGFTHSRALGGGAILLKEHFRGIPEKKPVSNIRLGWHQLRSRPRGKKGSSPSRAGKTAEKEYIWCQGKITYDVVQGIAKMDLMAEMAKSGREGERGEGLQPTAKGRKVSKVYPSRTQTIFSPVEKGGMKSGLARMASSSSEREERGK